MKTSRTLIAVAAALLAATAAFLILPTLEWWNLHVDSLNRWMQRWRESRPATIHPTPGNVEAGYRFFAKNCAGCHMVNGRGGILGPDLSNLGRERSLEQMKQALSNPDSLRTPGYQVVSARLRDGQIVRGLARNESTFDLQVQSLDGTLRVLSKDQIVEQTAEPKSLMSPVKAGGEEKRDLLAFLTRLTNEVPLLPPLSNSPESNPGIDFSRVSNPESGDWPTYNGTLSGNRYSLLREINTGNVSQLGAKWMFRVAKATQLEVTPVVVDGIMYATSANEAYALDAQSGRQIWHYGRPLTPGVIGDAGTAINRGVAILGDRIFMVTDNAHLLALNRVSGELLWDTQMADYRQNYGATSAPLIVNDLVVTGPSGGDEGVRGFIAAYKAATGELAWRFWTVPAPGEPGSETWVGTAIEHGCVTGWLTGTYDPSTNLIYWPTGNPCPDHNGDQRKGDNLYSNSVVALDPQTGKLRWHYQFTPHDLYDWDATEPLLLIDADFHGSPRKLLAQADRNGFFYVLDRVTGQFLLGEPFVHKLTWATGIGPDGRPLLAPNTETTRSGTKLSPCSLGATNWMSTAYNPTTGLVYVAASECSNLFVKRDATWKAGERFFGGYPMRIDATQKFIRAIDLQTGKIAWEVPLVGARSWGGVMSTAGDLVFFCDESGAFAALDSRSGKPLWHFHTNEGFRASPMTYSVDHKQHIAIAAGSTIVSFALP